MPNETENTKLFDIFWNYSKLYGNLPPKKCIRKL